MDKNFDQKPFPLNLSIIEMTKSVVDPLICGDCPFAYVVKREHNKPSKVHCLIFRDFFLSKTPIVLDSESVYYPYNYRLEISNDANGAKFSQITPDCEFNFSRIEDV